MPPSSQKKHISRKVHQLDAKDKPLGRLASQIANLLQGKHKVSYVPHQDRGDIVQISNIKQIKFTGKKLKNKVYYHHSGYPGSLKKQTLGELFTKDPAKLLRYTVFQMLPKNKLRKSMIKRLQIKS